MPATKSSRLRPTTPALIALLAVLSGCRVTGEDIEYWKGTVKGPGKIVAVMLADKYPMELRTQAALALVDMERPDRDGMADLQGAAERLDEKTRGDVIAGIVPGLEALMKQADPKAEGAATPRQIRAKDAAFILIKEATPEVKSKLTLDVVNWYVEDFNGRSLAGNYSAEQVIRALGSPAAKVLVKGLKARMPQQALIKMAQLIGQIADADARKEAAERLAAIEQEMGGADFLLWIKQTLAQQAQAQKVALDAKQLDKAAQANRDTFINEGAIPAMKWLADEPVVKRKLLALASQPLPGEAGMTRRVHALQALEGKVDRSDLQPLLAMALDKGNPAQVRDYAFDRVGDIRSAEALPHLWPIMSEDARLRWRAGEMVLAIGGAAIVPEFFSKLPTTGNGDYAAEELEGYATRMGQMTPLPTELVRTELGSTHWSNRVIAIRYFERKGTAEDEKRLEGMKGDTTPTKGPHWGNLKTVGSVAGDAADAAKQRLTVGGA